MTKSHDKTTARTIGNNHEWGITMIEPMLTYYDEIYSTYVRAGLHSQASTSALAATVAYIPVFKSQMVSIMQESYLVFDNFFSDESKMDFWNNCYGRAYPAKGFPDGASAFSHSAFYRLELVLDGPSTSNMAANLTAQQKQNMWAWDWYSY